MPAAESVLRSVKVKLGRVIAHPSAMNLFIVVLSLGLIAVVWATTIHRVNFERNATIADEFRQNSNFARAFEEHTIRTLKSIDQVLLLIRYQYLQQGIRLDLRRLISDAQIDDSLFTGLGVIDEHGDRVIGRDDYAPINVADREYFEIQRQQDVMCLTSASQFWGI